MYSRWGWGLLNMVVGITNTPWPYKEGILALSGF